MKNPSDEQDKLREHNFDGIQEYDNQLPTWWVLKFVITVIFAAGYFYWYQMSGRGPTLIGEMENEKKAEQVAILSKPEQEKPLDENELNALLKDQNILKAGAEIFQAKCVSCHANHGEGLVGPNLTDRYWIHGNKMTQIVTIIQNGVPAKGMIAWKTLMSKDEILHVASFIKSLEGKNLPGKKPEGDLIEAH